MPGKNTWHVVSTPYVVATMRERNSKKMIMLSMFIIGFLPLTSEVASNEYSQRFKLDS